MHDDQRRLMNGRPEAVVAAVEWVRHGGTQHVVQVHFGQL